MTDKIIDFSPGSPARARVAKDFQRKKWKLFRKWFFNNFNKDEQHNFQEEFYKDLIDSGINRLIAFVPWFMCKHVHNYISMLERDFTLSNGEITKAVRKAIRGDNHSINYDDYTYGKLISACVQEGLSLCNEIKLNQQIKRHRLNERKQLGEFCEQFAFDIPKKDFLILLPGLAMTIKVPNSLTIVRSIFVLVSEPWTYNNCRCYSSTQFLL